MDYRVLGSSGLKVSPIWLGVLLFGTQTDEAEAGRIVGSARAADVNCIDTADVYGDGVSEKVTGQLIAADRANWILASKVGNPMGIDPNARGLSRRWIMRAVELSLQRLRTDWIDIYYFHRPDPHTPLEESVVAMADLVRMGKIRYFGLSNYRGWEIARVIEFCRAASLPAPVVCQPCYNAMTRMAEVEIFPACAHYGLGVVPYSPLARGVLTGKYAPGAAPAADTRAGRKDRRILETEFRHESLEIAQKIKAYGESRGMTAGQFALNWVLNNRIVTSVLAGPRTLAQWEEYLGALQHRFTAEDEAFINGFVASGHPSTPGFIDPMDPPTGRVPRVG